jgi:hypothetical protein
LIRFGAKGGEPTWAIDKELGRNADDLPWLCPARRPLARLPGCRSAGTEAVPAQDGKHRLLTVGSRPGRQTDDQFRPERGYLESRVTNGALNRRAVLPLFRGQDQGPLGSHPAMRARPFSKRLFNLWLKWIALLSRQEGRHLLNIEPCLKRPADAFGR